MAITLLFGRCCIRFSARTLNILTAFCFPVSFSSSRQMLREYLSYYVIIASFPVISNTALVKLPLDAM
jgi:hypothetical protein